MFQDETLGSTQKLRHRNPSKRDPFASFSHSQSAGLEVSRKLLGVHLPGDWTTVFDSSDEGFRYLVTVKLIVTPGIALTAFLFPPILRCSVSCNVYAANNFFGRNGRDRERLIAQKRRAVIGLLAVSPRRIGIVVRAQSLGRCLKGNEAGGAIL